MQERNLCLQGINRFFANQIFPGFTYVKLCYYKLSLLLVYTKHNLRQQIDQIRNYFCLKLIQHCSSYQKYDKSCSIKSS